MKMTAISRVIANFLNLLFAVFLISLSIHLIHLAIGHIPESFQVESAVDSIFNAILLIPLAIVVFGLDIIIFAGIIWEGKKKIFRAFKRRSGREFNGGRPKMVLVKIIEA